MTRFLAVGIGGAVIARFQPEGWHALLAGKHQAPISSVHEIVGLNGIFVALFGASARLFRRAAPRA